MNMNMDMLKQVVIGIALVSLIAAATAIALDEFATDQYDDNLGAGCNATDKIACGSAYNITNEGLKGVSNSTSYLDTIGTIAGVAVLIGLVVGAFYFIQNK